MTIRPGPIVEGAPAARTAATALLGRTCRSEVAALWEFLAPRGSFCFANRRGLDPAPAFAVLAAVYDDIRNALHRSLPTVQLPGVTLWPVAGAAPAWAGAPVDAIRPVDAIASLRAPTLLVQGTEDPEGRSRRVPAALPSASPAPVHRIAWIAGLGDVDLFSLARDAYRFELERKGARIRSLRRDVAGLRRVRVEVVAA